MRVHLKTLSGKCFGRCSRLGLTTICPDWLNGSCAPKSTAYPAGVDNGRANHAVARSLPNDRGRCPPVGATHDSVLWDASLQLRGETKSQRGQYNSGRDK